MVRESVHWHKIDFQFQRVGNFRKHNHKNTPAPDYSLFQSFILNENTDGNGEKTNRTKKVNQHDAIEGNSKKCGTVCCSHNKYVCFCTLMFVARCSPWNSKNTFSVYEYVCLFRFRSLPFACHHCVCSFPYSMSAFMTLMECRTSNGMQIFSFLNSLYCSSNE